MQRKFAAVAISKELDSKPTHLPATVRCGFLPINHDVRIVRPESERRGCQHISEIHGVRRSSDHPFPRRVFPGRTPWSPHMRKLTLFLFALAATVSVATSSFACSMLLCGVGSTGSAASSFSWELPLVLGRVPRRQFRGSPSEALRSSKCQALMCITEMLTFRIFGRLPLHFQNHLAMFR